MDSDESFDEQYDELSDELYDELSDESFDEPMNCAFVVFILLYGTVFVSCCFCMYSFDVLI